MKYVWSYVKYDCVFNAINPSGKFWVSLKGAGPREKARPITLRWGPHKINKILATVSTALAAGIMDGSVSQETSVKSDWGWWFVFFPLPFPWKVGGDFHETSFPVYPVGFFESIRKELQSRKFRYIFHEISSQRPCLTFFLAFFVFLRCSFLCLFWK